MICGSAISYRNTLQNPDIAYPLTSEVPDFSMTSANSLINVLNRNLRNLRIIRALQNFRVFHRDRNQHTSWRPPPSSSSWPRPPAYQRTALVERRGRRTISLPTTQITIDYVRRLYNWNESGMNEWMNECGNALAVAVISLQLPAIPQVIVLNYRELITLVIHTM